MELGRHRGEEGAEGVGDAEDQRHREKAGSDDDPAAAGFDPGRTRRGGSVVCQEFGGKVGRQTRWVTQPALAPARVFSSDF